MLRLSHFHKHVDQLVARLVEPTGVELEAVATAVASRMHPVWTVCGPTGYGATSFAAALAAHIKGDYSGDVGQPSPPFPGGMYVETHREHVGHTE